MKRPSPILAAAAAAACGLAVFAAAPAAAQGKAGDAAWARCIWQTAPASATNWLAMPAPRFRDAAPTASERLGHRLRALCSSDTANLRNPPGMPSWGRLVSALRKARPASAGAADAATAIVSWCEHRLGAEGRESVYLYDVVRGADPRGPIAFQIYFGEIEGRPFRLPQGLRMMPAADARTSTSCRLINSTGETGDA
ncbi:MAG TPA: hypothetical protein VEZ20_08590 [Allosphingosinicella sp.]|jgi:hypothetical protein|nr:hypothetical protein [Allosphingosinicella sp.]